jgi:hypothetical protein
MMLDARGSLISKADKTGGRHEEEEHSAGDVEGGQLGDRRKA